MVQFTTYRHDLLKRIDKKHVITAGNLTHVSQDAEALMLKRVEKRLGKMETKSVNIIVKSLVKTSAWEELVNSIMGALYEEFKALGEESVDPLVSAARSGVSNGILQVEINDTTLVSDVNTVATEWAKERAAELVGMRYDTDGNLIHNPSADMAITDSTRNELRTIVSDLFSQKSVDKEKVVARIKQAGTFSDSRARTIANTEISRAQVMGNAKVWEESGVVESIEWFRSEDDPCDECNLNDGEVVAIGTLFPSGDAYPPVHPNCRCTVSIAELKES